MEQNTIEQIKLQIQKSEEKLNSARDLLKLNHIDDAISRAYYCIFHAASAVLLTKGIVVKSHSGLKTVFGLHFVEKGEIEKKFGEYLRNLQDDREDSDYDVYTGFERTDAEEAIKEAEEFVNRMKRYLSEKYGIDLTH